MKADVHLKNNAIAYNTCKRDLKQTLGSCLSPYAINTKSIIKRILMLGVICVSLQDRSVRGSVAYVCSLWGSVIVVVTTYLHAGMTQRQFAGVVVGTGHRRSDRLFVIISGFVVLQ